MQLAINLATTLAAVVFLTIGGIKLFYTRPYIAEAKWAQVRHPSLAGVRAVGAIEVIAALGLAMPPIVGLGQPVIPIISALILIASQLSALFINARTRSWTDATVSAAYILLPAFLVVIYATVSQASVNWV